MTDALALSGMIQSINALAQIGKSLVGIHDANAIREKAVELNREILSAQASALATQADQFALLKRIGELEEQVADLKAWDTEAQTYQLKDIALDGSSGQLAYVPKEGTHTLEPPHLLCANCYEEGHKSFLQTELRQPGGCDVRACHRCGSDLYLWGYRRPEHIQTKAVVRRAKN